MPAEDAKQCVHCGAYILAAAIKCRYCFNFQEVAPEPAPELAASPTKGASSGWSWLGGVPLVWAGLWWWRTYGPGAPDAPSIAAASKAVMLSLFLSLSPAASADQEDVTVTVWNHGGVAATAVSVNGEQWVSGQLVDTATCFVGLIGPRSNGECTLSFDRPSQDQRAEYRVSASDGSGKTASGTRLGIALQDTTQNSTPTYAPSVAASDDADNSASSNPYACQAGEDGGTDDGDYYDPSEYMELHFAWEYGGWEWSWDPLVPKEWRDYYKQRERTTSGQNFGVFATDPYGAPVISQVVCILEEAAAQEGYTPWETAEFALSFVQSLRYVSDRVGEGYDEYPKFPIETLMDEGGDCEDSAILFASLIKGLGYGSVLLLLPGHAATGVLVNGDVAGSYYTYNGGRYYYAETTNTGWEIGQVPDSMEGQKAQVIPLVPRAVLGSMTWDAPTYEDGLFHYVVEVTNLGSAAVTDLSIMMGYDAGNNRIWSKTTYAEGLSLDPDETVWVDFWLEPPPRDTYTRSIAWAWGSNAATVQGASEYFST